MNESDSKFSTEDPIEAMAARWIARRDRGLTQSEQTAYQQWLDEDPRHTVAMRRPELNWSALDQLAQHFPMEGTEPNADLLAPPRRRARWYWFPALAAAAAVALIYFGRAPGDAQKTVTYSNPGRSDHGQAVVRLEPERHVLEDGSVVELNALATVEVRYTAAERQVRLVRGEAFFIVAKNPQRPFRVSANQVTVQAVGTAFSVGLDPKELSVLVTEGKVRVDEIPTGAREQPAAPRELSALHAGQQGVFNLTPPSPSGPAPEMEVKALTPSEVDLALAWRNLQLEFTNLPLSDAVAEFNRHTSKKLVVADAETAAIQVGGIFRADNVAAFVSLLDTLGVSATDQGGQIILRKAHAP
jgi:transmembrane sensor